MERTHALPLLQRLGAGLIRLWPELLLVLLGTWLRWKYAASSHMVEDEFFEALVLRDLPRHGIPLFESGVLRQRGWVYLYSTLPFVILFGPVPLVMRLPTLIFEALLIGLVACFGRREWHRLVGLGAAALVALLSTLIANSPRVRFYAPFVLFAFLSVWFAWQSVRRPTRTANHRAFAVAFGLAIMSHEEALLLYPALVLLMTLWGGRRYWQQRSAWTAHAGVGLFVVVRALLEAIANLQTPALPGVQGKAKPYLEPFVEMTEKWHVYQPLYFSASRWPITLAGMAAVFCAFYWWKRRATGELGRTLPQALSFLLFPSLSVLLFLIVLAGSTWREVRYMLFAEPLVVLAATAGAWHLTRSLPRYLNTTAFLLWVVVAGALLWPETQSATAIRNQDYAGAFRYVVAHRDPDDVVVSPLVHVCAFVVPGGCDYYMREDGYEPYVIVREGHLVDRWTGAPLLHRPEELEALVKTAPRVWAVADGHRFGVRYRDAFRRILLEQFRVVAEFEGGVRVALAEGWREPPFYTVDRPLSLPVGPFTLERLERTPFVVYGDHRQLALVLHWSFPEDFPVNLHTSVKLVDRGGENIAQADGPPANGLVGTGEEPRQPLPDFKTLWIPADVPEGLYRLEVRWYEPSTLTPFSPSVPFEWVRVGPPPEPAHDREVVWQNGLVLLGHEDLPAALVPGEALRVELVWGTRREVGQDLTVSVQLLGPGGNLVAQDDHPPLGGFYPTSRWVAGETVVADTYTLAVPEELGAGLYRLVVVWYDGQTLRRVPLVTGEDAFELARWEKVP